ncbi:MAG TPA: MaoC family dehydratase [Chloroflexia bacterium]|nr:MaoC family dehydratase [Chloroflexia bacterium]
MIYFEDMKEGDVIELGSRSVSREEIVTFATEYDPQPIHVDEKKAEESIYGGIIASGWLTGSILMRLLVDNLLNHTISMGSPGIDELRWIRPVRPGDTLTARLTVVETRPSNSRPNLGIVRSRSEMYNQNGELIMTVQATNLFGRRPAQD